MGYRELGPAGLAVVQAVDGALNSQDTHLLVACSGGADSLALAFAARHVAIRRYLEYAAVVIDHQLQEGSTEVAARVQQQLDGLGYDDVTVTAVQVDRSATVGPEAAAARPNTRPSIPRPERVLLPCCSLRPSTTRPRRAAGPGSWIGRQIVAGTALSRRSAAAIPEAALWHNRAGVRGARNEPWQDPTTQMVGLRGPGTRDVLRPWKLS